MEQDLERLIQNVYRAAFQPAEWNQVMISLREKTGAVAASMGVLTRENQSKLSWTSHDKENAACYHRYADCNPYVSAGHHLLRPGKVLLGEHLCQPDVVRRSRFFREYMQPMSVDEIVCSVALDQGGVTSGLVLEGDHRSLRVDRAIELLEEINPHVTRALSIAAKYDFETVTSRYLSAMLDQIVDGMFFLNRSGEVIHCNRAGYDMLADPQRPLHTSRKRLRFDCVSVDSRFQRELRRLFAVTCGESSFQFEHRGILLYVSINLILHQADLDAETVIVRIFRRSVRPDYVLIKHQYGLTNRECEFLSEFFSRISMTAVARSLNIKLETARKHLKSCFRKLKVGSQAELIKKIVQVVEWRP